MSNSKSKSKHGNFIKKCQTFGTFLSVIWFYRDCHTGAGTSYGVLKLETHLRIIYIQVQRALSGDAQVEKRVDCVVLGGVALGSIAASGVAGASGVVVAGGVAA